jgi:hypothetical protein
MEVFFRNRGLRSLDGHFVVKVNGSDFRSEIAHGFNVPNAFKRFSLDNLVQYAWVTG